jgi:hypothetical protein
MDSPTPKTIPTHSHPDLPAQLTRLGLKATAQELENFLGAGHGKALESAPAP